MAERVGVEPSPFGAPRFSGPLARRRDWHVPWRRRREWNSGLSVLQTDASHLATSSWLRGLGSNQRISGFRDRRLTVLATPHRCLKTWLGELLVRPVRVELT